MKVMIDTNVFIFGIERPISNSNVIIGLIFKRNLKPVFSELLVDEISDYFKRNYSKNTGWLVSDLIKKLPNVSIESESEIKSKINKNIEKYGFSEEDVVHFTIAEEFDVEYLISLNRHFLKKKIKKPIVVSPHDFLKNIGVEPITDFE